MMARQTKGAGRPAFVMMLDEIKADLRRGIFVKDIFRKHQAVIGIGYPSFCKLVARYAADAKLVPSAPPPTKPSPAVQAMPTRLPQPVADYDEPSEIPRPKLKLELKPATFRTSKES
jgi:hypothetical protein